VVELLNRWLCTVTYHGAFFSGWQSQKEGSGIQDVIQKVLSDIHQVEVRITASGRTDAGVHALAQRFHFDSSLDLDGDTWTKAMNAQLPPSIRIIHVESVASDFHARYHVKSKRYRYRVSTQALSPFNHQLMYYEHRTLEIEAIRQVMPMFVGTHDFTSFNATPLTEVENQVRKIYHFELIEQDGKLDFIIEGSGFLRYMVRMLVAACLDVGAHKMGLNDVKNILELRDKRAYSGLVSASGLYLEEVKYNETAEE
jgi:tRNA pseudouridine38-40 synthase